MPTVSRCFGLWENSSDQSRQKSLPSWSFCFKEKGGNYIAIIGERENLTLWLAMNLESDVLM